MGDSSVGGQHYIVFELFCHKSVPMAFLTKSGMLVLLKTDYV